MITEAEDRFTITLTSEAYARFVELDVTELDAIFSDNYFDLSAGAQKTVTVLKSAMSRPAELAELRERLTVRSVFDI
ncbi:hypothetical protein D3C74_388570 [compost metagenome]